MEIFKPGNVLKSNMRTKGYPLFVMVLPENNTSCIQFNGVVLKDYIKEEMPGTVCNTWNKTCFTLSNWKEFKNFI